MSFRAFGLCVLFVIAAYGWGTASTGFRPFKMLQLPSMRVACGVAVLGFLGGILNLARLAHAGPLYGLLGIGALFAITDMLRRWKTINGRKDSLTEQQPRTLIPRLPIYLALVLGLFAAVVFTNTSVYNIYDDFHTYMPRVFRMLQSGTLSGNAFDSMGIDSLGVQSFFHGFFMPGDDVRMLNCFDAVICLFLVALLLAEISVYWGTTVSLGALTVLSTLVINPQYVNISPLFSGAAGMVALIFAGTIFAERMEIAGKAENRWNLLILGLLTGFLVALKLTMAFFALIYFGVLFGILWTRRGNSALKIAMTTAVWAVCAVMPWLLLHLPTIFEVRKVAKPFLAAAVLVKKHSGIATGGVLRLVDLDFLPYGNHALVYNLAALTCGLGGGIAFVLLWRKASQKSLALCSICAGGVGAGATYVLNAKLFLAEDGIRYSCPVIIGAFGITLLGLAKFGGHQKIGLCLIKDLAAGCLFGVLLLFSHTFPRRITFATRNHTLLAFNVNDAFRKFSCEEITQQKRDNIRRIQNKLHPRARTLVWISPAMHLDFKRNELWTTSEPGLINPAIETPAGIPAETLRQYLQALGVRYVWLQYSGAGIKHTVSLRTDLDSPFPIYKKLAEYAIYFRETLGGLAESSKVVHRDNEMIIFEVAPR